MFFILFCHLFYIVNVVGKFVAIDWERNEREIVAFLFALGQCSKETCVHGQCFANRCVCFAGVTGEYCNTDLIDCDENSCLNDGSNSRRNERKFTSFSSLFRHVYRIDQWILL